MQSDNLEQAIDAFLAYLAHEKHSAPNTLAAYQTDLAQFRQFVRDRTKTGELVEPAASEDLVPPELVAAFVFALRERGYSPATIARRIAAVKSFFAYAQAAGRVTRNPAETLGPPRVPRPERKEVSPSEIQALLDGCSGDTPEALRNRAMFMLLYQTGLRVSEVVALDVDDVDARNGQVTARTRTGRTRVVPVPSAARAAIDQYLSDGRAALARGPQERALFLNGRGGRLTRQGFWLIITTRARQSGVNSAVSPHALRNSFARERLASGTALSDLKELLGHVSISTTRAYARSSGTPQKQPAPA